MITQDLAKWGRVSRYWVSRSPWPPDHLNCSLCHWPRSSSDWKLGEGPSSVYTALCFLPKDCFAGAARPPSHSHYAFRNPLWYPDKLLYILPWFPRLWELSQTLSSWPMSRNHVWETLPSGPLCNLPILSIVIALALIQAFMIYPLERQRDAETHTQMIRCHRDHAWLTAY